MDADQMIKYLRCAAWRAHKEGEWTKEETFGFVGRLTELKHHLEEEIYKAQIEKENTLASIARLNRENQKNEAPEQEQSAIAKELTDHLESCCKISAEKLGRSAIVSKSLEFILINIVKETIKKVFAEKTSTKP
jgi:hypothetical protein